MALSGEQELLLEKLGLPEDADAESIENAYAERLDRYRKDVEAAESKPERVAAKDALKRFQALESKVEELLKPARARAHIQQAWQFIENEDKGTKVARARAKVRIEEARKLFSDGELPEEIRVEIAEIEAIIGRGDAPEASPAVPEEAPVESQTEAKKTPKIAWSSPNPIIEGKPLGDAQLNATADVEGDFHYDPGVGSVLDPGIHRLSVVFHPADPDRFERAAAAVQLVVEKKPVLPAEPERPPVPDPPRESKPETERPKESEAPPEPDVPEKAVSEPTGGSRLVRATEAPVESRSSEQCAPPPGREEIEPCSVFTLFDKSRKRCHVFGADSLVIGRKRTDCDILARVRDAGDPRETDRLNVRISRRHATLARDGNNVVLFDGYRDPSGRCSPSSNGVYLNRERVHDPVFLPHDARSEIRVGPDRRFPGWRASTVLTWPVHDPPDRFSCDRSEGPCGLFLERLDDPGENILIVWRAVDLHALGMTKFSWWLVRHEDGFIYGNGNLWHPVEPGCLIGAWSVGSWKEAAFI